MIRLPLIRKKESFGAQSRGTDTLPKHLKDGSSLSGFTELVQPPRHGGFLFDLPGLWDTLAYSLRTISVVFLRVPKM